MVLGIEHFMTNAAAFQKCRQLFTDLHGDRTHQHRLTLGMMLFNGIQNGIELGFRILVDNIIHILADVWPVGGNLHHVQTINCLEFLLFRLGCTCHTSQLFIHAEVVLESDGGQRHTLALHLHMFFGFDGLVQTF